MALPTRLFQSLGVPVPAVTENTATRVPGHENNNIRLYELFDVDFDPSLLSNGDRLTYSSSLKKFVKSKNSFANAVAPAATDDSGDGYTLGSMWFDTVASAMYIAVDVTVGAAVWEKVS